MRWWLLLVPLVVGCPDVEGPCDLDRYGCDDGVSGFEIDAECGLEGSLTVTIGTGETAFEPLEVGAWPTVYSGSQGGNHLFAALRVDGVATDRHRQLKLSINVRDEEDQAIGNRAMILKLTPETNILPNGRVEDFGLIIFVNSPSQGTMKISVTDPCGRTGQAEHSGNSGKP